MLTSCLIGDHIGTYEFPACEHKNFCTVKKSVKKFDQGLGGSIVNELLTENPARRLTATGLVANLREIGVRLVGGRVVSEGFDRVVTPDWMRQLRGEAVCSFDVCATKCATKKKCDEALAFANVEAPSSSPLSEDEIAAVVLYTMPIVYQLLNAALRSGEENCIAPFRRFARLLLSALVKLPSYNGVVYRAINARLGNGEYTNGSEIMWGGLSSCSIDGSAVDEFLGDSNTYRTLFAIDVKDGKAICEYSAFEAEAEVLLPIGTRLVVKNSCYLHSRLLLVNLSKV